MKLRYRINALIIAVAMLSSILTGCAATGSSSPEALVKRVMHAVFAVDGEEVMDCILPELSAAYRLSRQLTMQLTGEDPELEIMEDFLDSISVTYNIKKEDISSVNPSTYVISKQQNDTTAMIRTLITLEINDQFDYCECYVQTMKIDGKWYMSSILTSSPAGYKPNTVKLTDDELNQIKAGLDGNKLEYDPTAMRALNDLTIGDIPITSEVMQATWDVIEGYTKGQQYQLEKYVNDDQATDFLFEDFVIAYQNDPAMRAAVAATESLNAVANFTSDVVSYFFGDIESAPIIKMFDTDHKVAQIIIDYLVSFDLAEEAEKTDDMVINVEIIPDLISWYGKVFSFLGKENTITEKELTDTLEVLRESYKTILEKNDLWDGDMWDNIKATIYNNQIKGVDFSTDNLAELLSDIPVKVGDGGWKKYKLGDVYKITSKNAGDISKFLQDSLKDNPAGNIDIIDNDITNYIDLDFMYEYNKSSAKKASKNVTQKVIEEINNAKESLENTEAEKAEFDVVNPIVDKVGKFISFTGAVFASVDAYNQLFQYEQVLDKFKVELEEILTYSNCDNADIIVNEVIDTLSSAVAKTVVKVTLTAFFESAVTDWVDDGIAKLLSEAGTKVCGVAISGPIFVFEIAWNTTAFFGNYSQSRLQVWGVEDLHRDFLETKKDLRMAMYGFYNLPTDVNFKKLYYISEYYSLLVNAGSKKVSDILCADAESLGSKFTNFVTGLMDGVDFDFRLDAIEYYKKIPEKDEIKLYNFHSRLFPAM